MIQSLPPNSMLKRQQQFFVIRFLNNRSIAGKMIMLVLPLVVLSTLGIAGVAWNAYRQLQRSETLRTANRSSEYILRAAAEQAKERGFTAAVLANPQDTATRGQISNIRMRGDVYCDSALTAALPIVYSNSERAKTYQKLLTLRTRRDSLRREFDAVLGVQMADGASIALWIQAQTTLIVAERLFANALFASESRLESILEFNSQITSSVFAASEFAGRERATIGTVLAGGRPIPPERLNFLMQYRGVVQENIAVIVEFGERPSVPPAIRKRVEDVKRIFLQEFEQTRALVYQASAQGQPYAISSPEWIAQSTRAINSILAVSEAISDETVLRGDEEYSQNNRIFLLSGAAFIVLLVVIAFAFVLGHSIVTRLQRLQRAAKHIADGDFSAVQLTSDNDEIGAVSSSFQKVVTTIQHFNASQQSVLEQTLAGTMSARTDSARYKGDFRTMTEGINALLDAVNRPVEEALRVLQHLANSDFTHTMTGDYQGDHTALKNALNSTIAAITETLSNVLRTADHIAQNAEQVALVSHSLSQGTVEQAASLQEISSSLQLIASQITHTSREAHEAKGMSNASRDKAELGDTEMRRLVTAMGDITASSKSMAGIIKVIDGIAFQTNLLALNAAVEAARAGRAGSGFAVVAEEVRSLAARSATSARQTAELIEGAITNALLGSATADIAAQRLREIVHDSNNVLVVVHEIAQSAQVQAGGIQEITIGLQQIDKVVQMTAANAEECAAAAAELEYQARQLNTTLTTFQL
jgi:methyl-accepting chemotaxis protein